MVARNLRSAISAVGLSLAASAVMAQMPQPFIYPSRGQSPQQTEIDRGQCYTWAVQQSGYDPTRPPPPPPPPTGGGSSSDSFVAKGIFGGALLGAGIGAATGGSAGEGAAIGALFGGIRRAVQSGEQQQQQQHQAQAQAHAFQAQGISNYQRAFAACMGGRGYTVN